MNLKETLKYLKLQESAISMILGVVVIFFSGFLLINYFSNKPNRNSPVIEIGDESIDLQKTHTVAEGEDLWSIAEKYYGNGEKWVEIVRENNIEDADKLIIGQVLTIPNPTQEGQNQLGVIAERTAIVSTTPTLSAESTENPEPTSTQTPSPTVFTENGQGAISTEAKIHIVQNGENLWSIAEQYYNSGYNWVDISRINKLANADNLQEGQELIIPNVEAKKTTTLETPEKEASTVSTKISGTEYTVQKGDSLWNIAVRAYGDGYKWIEISRENKLLHPGIIHPGNMLSLPR